MLEIDVEFVAANEQKTTVGAYIEGLLSDTNYYNTILPRTPVLINREILKRLLSLPEKLKLKQTNETSDSFTKGS